MIAPTEAPSTPLPLREFYCHAIEHRRRAATAFVLVAGSALLIAALLPPQYRATAILAVLPSPEFTVRPAAGSHDLNTSALAMDQIMKAETDILGSDDLHAATLRAVGPALVYPDIFSPATPGAVRHALQAAAALAVSPWRVTPTDAAAWRQETGLRHFGRDLDILPAKDSNVITITFDSANAAIAAAAVNTMLRLYAARRSRLYNDPQLEVVRGEAESASLAVAQADQRLAAFKRSLGIADLDQQRSLLLQRHSQAEQAMAEAAISSAENRTRLDVLTRQIAAEPTTVGLFSEQDNDTRLQAVNAGLQDLRARQAAESQKYRDDSRMMAMLRAQIASHEAEVRRLQHAQAASVLRQGRNPSLDPLLLDRARAAVALAAADARVGGERAQSSALAGRLADLEAETAALAALQREQSSAQDDFRTASHILAERQLSETEDARRFANVRVIQPALVPQHPRPWPMLVIIAGLLSGVLAALAALIDRFVRRPVFLTAEGLEAATGLPVLAVFGPDRAAQSGPMPAH